MNIQIRPIALAIAVFIGASSVAYAQAAPNSDTQDRLGLLLNIPFDGSGFKFADAILSLAYQTGEVTVNGNVSGWQVSIGSYLTKFAPTFSASALAGERCTYGSVGVSYGDGKWGLPVFIHAAHIQLGLTNAGGFGGGQFGVSSLECFKRYVPSTTVPSSGSGSSSGSSSGSASGSGTTVTLGASLSLSSEFDWA